MRRYLALFGALVVAAGVGYVVLQLVCAHATVAQLEHKADSLAGADAAQKATLTQVRQESDTALAGDSTIPRPAARKVLARERATCVQVINTCDARVQNYQAQIKALTPRLRVFASLGYEARPDTALLAGDLSARAGAAFRVKGLDIEVYGKQPLLGRGKPSIGVEAKKYWRLF